MQKPNTSRRFPGRSFAIAFVAMPLLTLGALAAIGTPPSVIALNQKVKGDGVSITYAYLPKDGALAIFAADKSGRTGSTPLGRVSLSAGDHRNIKVTLKPTPKAGTELWAVLEQARGNQQLFKTDGKPAEETFKAL